MSLWAPSPLLEGCGEQGEDAAASHQPQTWTGLCVSELQSAKQRSQSENIFDKSAKRMTPVTPARTVADEARSDSPVSGGVSQDGGPAASSVGEARGMVLAARWEAIEDRGTR